MEEMKYTYAELQKRYKRVMEQKKKYDKEATILYYENLKMKEKIKELQEELDDRKKQIKELKIINASLYDEIYKRR